MAGTLRAFGAAVLLAIASAGSAVDFDDTSITQPLNTQLLNTQLLNTQPPEPKPFKTWMEQRYAGVVRQSKDYSCGLAALATLLTYYYGDPVSEADLLATLYGTDIVSGVPINGVPESDARDNDLARIPYEGVTFAHLARLARDRGYGAAGFELGAASLAKLTRPVIVALSVDGQAHFSVLRRVTKTGVAVLADPSWGNFRYGSYEFRKHFLGHSRQVSRQVSRQAPQRSPHPSSHESSRKLSKGAYRERISGGHVQGDSAIGRVLILSRPKGTAGPSLPPEAADFLGAAPPDTLLRPVLLRPGVPGFIP